MNIPLNIDWQQILLHAFNFVILAAGLYALLYKPVKEFMKKREAYYAEMAESAKKKVEEAEVIQANIQQQMDFVEQEIEQKKQQAAREIEAYNEKERTDARAEADQILADARAMGEQEKARIIKEAQKEIADLVSQETEKLVMKTLSEAYDQFLDSAEGSVTDAI